MISNNKPENKVLSRKSLDETLCNYNNSDINVVECKIQRPLVWSYDCIETLWTDLCECIRRNALNTPTKSISGQKIFNNTYTYYIVSIFVISLHYRFNIKHT